MRWTIKPKPELDKVKELAEQLNVENFVATLLVQRGINTFEQAKTFFRPSLSDLHDPYLMKDMDKAVKRIETAIANGENILIFGDYDVDGTTAVSLMSSYLKSYYPNVDTYIPDRYNEGYGISTLGIDYAEDNDITLIIALDCGIKSVDKIEYANAKSIDFIICDHHRPGNTLPNAVAVLDPKREDCNYPYKELCGCGIGFKLIQALGLNKNQTINDLLPYLDLVATAIGADIVPLTGENRILAKFGLEVINSNPRPGLIALATSLKNKPLTLTDVVFVIAPRINAAGRIKHGNYAVQLLTEFNLEQATQFAKEIELFNTERKNLVKKITLEALLQIKTNQEELKFSTVVYQEDWHKGVIGIVASRLIETYYRPTLVFTKSGDKYAASARSVKDFDVYNALVNCSEHIEQFGGHMYAAGLTLKEENFEAFKNAFEEEVKKTINPELLKPEILIDAEINFNDISDKFIRLLTQFEPFGPENMTPVFLSKDVRDTGYAQTIGQDKDHLKLFVKQGNSEGVSAIGFNLGNKLDLTTNNNLLEMAYCIEENTWNGKVTVQFRLKDIR